MIAVALGAGVLGFLPFNLRPGKQAHAWMGDSGSQLIGFTLASLGLASSYTVATSTVATLVLPVLILAVPILDTTLVTVVRLLEGRPVVAGRPRPHLAPARVTRSLRDRSRRPARADLGRRSERRASPTRRSATAGWPPSGSSSPSRC